MSRIRFGWSRSRRYICSVRRTFFKTGNHGQSYSRAAICVKRDLVRGLKVDAFHDIDLATWISAP